jgi:signal transduction histidine kinase/DNA-binding response OmpR family regulator
MSDRSPPPNSAADNVAGDVVGGRTVAAAPADTRSSTQSAVSLPASGNRPRALRLRTLLTVPFVLLIVAPAMVIAGSLLYTGLQAVDVLSRQLMEDISARVGQAAVHQLEEAAITLRSTFPNSEVNQNASLDMFIDDERLERKLFELTADTRTTGYLYFGRENGSFVGVDRGRPGARAAATVRLQKSGGEPRTIYSARAPGDRTRLIETESRVYDARSRVWYQLAKAAQRLTWTPVYVSFASGALVTTAAQPVVSPSGTLFGVLAADVELSELSTFMKTVAVSANGVAFIVDRDGMLVASSTPEQPFRNEDGVQKRVAARDSQFELVRAAAQWWRVSGRRGSASPNIDLITSTGESVDVASRHVGSIDGIDWDIVVAIPRSDFTAPIVKNAVGMFFVILAALAAALMLGLWVLRRVTRDVDHLVAATRDASADGLPATMPVTALAETGVLGQAFGEMVLRLRQSLLTIRNQNDQFAQLNATLEDRVERRTTQLAEQNLTLTEEILRRERLERELRHTSQAAQKAAEDKARFLAILSHELRTPLQAVVGASQLLAARRDSGVRAEEVETIDAASKSLLTLIDGVLSYSRLEAGVVTPVLSSFGLRDCIGEAERVVLSAYTRPDVRLVVNVEPSVPPRIHTDAGMLRQILINLLGNSMKFTAAGEVRLTVTADAPARPDEPHLLRFSVADTGPGIDSETQQRLFQPFQQGGSGTVQAVATGSGLGLVICSLLVKALGGTIEMKSEPGKGTHMTFTVLAQSPAPLAAVSDLPGHSAHHAADTPLTGAASAGLEATRGPGRLRPLAVMVVEDNDVNRELLGILLEQLGHQVTAVGDGEDAIAACEGGHFDVVLMDLNLPRIGGIEATRRILHRFAERAADRDAAPAPTIIALTASVSDADRAMCAAAGMRGFLTKPATVFSLDAALREATKGREPSAASTASSTVIGEPALDEETLNSLADLESRAAEPFLERLIARFLQGLPDDVAAVRSQWKKGDARATAARAHALAGAASAVGASALARAARSVCDAPDDATIGNMDTVAAATRLALAAWSARRYSGNAGR